MSLKLDTVSFMLLSAGTFYSHLNKFWALFSEASPVTWNWFDPLKACSPVLLRSVQNSL